MAEKSNVTKMMDTLTTWLPIVVIGGVVYVGYNLIQGLNPMNLIKGAGKAIDDAVAAAKDTTAGHVATEVAGGVVGAIGGVADAVLGIRAPESSAVTHIKTDINVMKGKINENAGDIVTLKGQIADHDGRITSLEGDVDEIQSEVKDHEGRITSLESNVDNLGTVLAANSSAIKDLQNWADELEHSERDRRDIPVSADTFVDVKRYAETVANDPTPEGSVLSDTAAYWNECNTGRTTLLDAWAGRNNTKAQNMQSRVHGCLALQQYVETGSVDNTVIDPLADQLSAHVTWTHALASSEVKDLNMATALVAETNSAIAVDRLRHEAQDDKTGAVQEHYAGLFKSADNFAAHDPVWKQLRGVVPSGGAAIFSPGGTVKVH